MDNAIFWIGITSLLFALALAIFYIFRPIKFGTLNVTLKDDSKFVYTVELDRNFDKVIFKKWAKLAVKVNDERTIR